MSKVKHIKILNPVMYTVGTVIYLFSIWVVSAVIVRVTGLDDAGYFGLALTVSGMFYIVCTFGIRSYQISDLKPLFSDSTYIATRLITTLFGLICTVIYCVLMGYNNKQIVVITVFMIFKCFESVYDVYHGIWQKKDCLVWVGVSLIIKGVLNVVSFCVVYFISNDLLKALISIAVTALLLLIVDVIFTDKKIDSTISVKFDFKEIVKLLKATIFMMALILCSPLIQAIPRIILERFEGRELLGVYSSLATPVVLISTVTSTLFSPFIPKYTMAFEEKEKKQIYKMLGLSVAITLVIGFVAIVAVPLLGEWAVNLVYGQEVARYYKFLYGFIINIVLVSIIICLNNIYIGIRKLVQVFGFMLAGCVLCCAFSLLLIPKYSMAGAINSMIIAQILQIVIELIYISVVIHKS